MGFFPWFFGFFALAFCTKYIVFFVEKMLKVSHGFLVPSKKGGCCAKSFFLFFSPPPNTDTDTGFSAGFPHCFSPDLHCFSLFFQLVITLCELHDI